MRLREPFRSLLCAMSAASDSGDGDGGGGSLLMSFSFCVSFAALIISGLDVLLRLMSENLSEN
jgi:hypothetical protein